MNDDINVLSPWFPVRITSVLAGPKYIFVEVWALPGGAVADKIGGNVNTSFDPGYAIDGATFAATAAGSPVQVLARRAPGAGGTQWELKGFGNAVFPPVSEFTGYLAQTGSAAYWAQAAVSGALLPYNGVNLGSNFIAFATGFIDRTGLGAAEVRIAFASDSINGSPLTAGLDEFGAVVITCPANQRTAFSIAANFTTTSNPYFGVVVENISAGSPSGGVPPTAILSQIVFFSIT